MTQTLTTFRFTCPDTGFPVDGHYDEATGEITLEPDPPMDADVDKRFECCLWCIRSEMSRYDGFTDVRERLALRGVDPSEL